MARQRKAYKKIVDTFLALLSKRPYHAISVSDIIAQAQVARPTFYRNFLDKRDLAACICIEDMKVQSDGNSWQDETLKLLDNVAARACFYHRIFPEQEGTQNFEEPLQQYHQDYAKEPLSPQLISLYSKTLALWVRSDFKSSKEEILRQLLFHQPIGQVLGEKMLRQMQKSFLDKKLTNLKIPPPGNRGRG